MTEREPPSEQYGLIPMVNVIRIALANLLTAWGASYQPPTFMGICVTISYTCLPYLPS